MLCSLPVAHLALVTRSSSLFISLRCSVRPHLPLPSSPYSVRLLGTAALTKLFRSCTVRANHLTSHEGLTERTNIAVALFPDEYIWPTMTSNQSTPSPSQHPSSETNNAVTDNLQDVPSDVPTKHSNDGRSDHIEIAERCIVSGLVPPLSIHSRIEILCRSPPLITQPRRSNINFHRRPHHQPHVISNMKRDSSRPFTTLIIA